MKIHNKLVRDRIPEIIEGSGAKPCCRILSHSEYLRALEVKMQEELNEFHQDQTLEELADMAEVLRALCIAKGYTPEQLESVRQQKAAERGAFANRIFLETTN